MDLRATIGRVLALLGVVGIFVLEGSSWEDRATTLASRAGIGWARSWGSP